MAYTFIKAHGRVSIYQDGDFHHQQFRKHWAYRDPEAYIARMVADEAEAAEFAARVRAVRLEQVAAYLERRASRVAAQPMFEWAQAA